MLHVPPPHPIQEVTGNRSLIYLNDKLKMPNLPQLVDTVVLRVNKEKISTPYAAS